MPTKYAKHFSPRKTPQSEPIPGKNQVENSAGGFGFEIEPLKRLDRFLILGCEGGTYYSSEQKLTKENAKNILELLKGGDGLQVVNRIVQISQEGRATKNDPAIFALSVCASLGNKETKKAALNALPKVCRIGTHLFTFLEYIEEFRGWGRGLREAVAKWYNEKDPCKLAYQLVKYRQRNGWSHRDALRLSHPKPSTEEHNKLFGYVTQDKLEAHSINIIAAFEQLQVCKSPGDVCRVLKGEKSLSWEMVPSEFLGSREVWETLLPNLPMTALIRNLGRLTANGAIKPLHKSIEIVTEKLTNQEFLSKARVHPIQVLAALTTYREGQGARGNLCWGPISQVCDALDEAFYLSFKNVEPTGKRMLLALDVSGSMGFDFLDGIPGLTPRVGSAAMALVTAKTEKNYHFTAFSDKMVPISISPRERLDDVVQTVSKLPFGGTNCALPMMYALEKRLEVDLFVVYTDNETWAGRIHPSQALEEYRRKMGIASKLAVVGMSSTGFSIADPSDPGMMDFVGFDTSTPNALSEFAIL